MDDFVTEFNEKEAAKSREACERIEREDAERGSGQSELGEVERMILDAWPRFEDGSPVWFGDAVEAHHDGAIVVEAIEFSRGKVCVKDAEDGDWGTSMYAMHPLKRPRPKVLDADGVEIKVGDTVWYGDFVSGVVKSIDTGSLMNTVRYINEKGCEYRDAAKDLTHVRPDSWERLDEDARKGPCEYFGVDVDRDVGCSRCPHYHGDRDCQVDMNADVVRRARRMAGDED